MPLYIIYILCVNKRRGLYIFGGRGLNKKPFGRKCSQDDGIRDSPYYVFVALCIVVIVVSLIKILASNENIGCFREYFAVGNRAPDPSFF